MKITCLPVTLEVDHAFCWKQLRIGTQTVGRSEVHTNFFGGWLAESIKHVNIHILDPQSSTSGMLS